MIGLWKISKGKDHGLLAIYVLHSIKKNPKSGYKILSEIKQKCKDEWSPSKGTVYPLLKQLEEEHMIRVKKIGPRSKKVFEISPKGKKFLASLHKKKEKLREKFSHFRNLFADIIGEENMNITSLVLEIKETSLTKTKKEKVKKILEDCLSKLGRVE